MSEPVLKMTSSIRDAIASIERTRRFIAAVVDDAGILRGIVSDGDIRRAILAGQGLDGPVTAAMTVRPITGSGDATDDELLHDMLDYGVAALPVVDAGGRFLRIVQISDLSATAPAGAGGAGYWGAVIMAGGEGRRLRPLTSDLPKPMIEVGGVPLLERQVRALAAGGVQRIFISTNYLGHVIEDHFADGAAFGAEIHYIREKEKLGTAGALSLLPARPEGPLLVMNGDVLTNSDYGKLLAYHVDQTAFLTVACVEYRVQIPFGVIRTKGQNAVAIEEKPSQRFLCNAGIYVLSRGALDLVEKGVQFDMTDLIAAAISGGREVSVFPIHEYWADIGNQHDLELAQQVFERTGDA